MPLEDIFDRSVHPLYSVMAFVFAGVVFLLILRLRISNKAAKKEAYYPLFCWTVFFCLQDGIWGLFAAHIFKNSAALMVSSTVFHLCSALTPIFWVLYMIASLKVNVHNIVKIKFAAILFSTIEFAMIVVNLKTHFMFFVDGDGFYTTTGYRAVLFYMQFAIYIAIGLVSMIILVRMRENVNRSSFFAVFCVNLSPIFFGFFQMLYPDAPANSIGFSIGCLIIYTFISAGYEKEVLELREREDYIKIISRQNDELRVQQESMQELLKLAEEANRAKTTFLFNMSHDIRTPMNAIIGYTEYAIRTFDNKKVLKDSLKKIRVSSELLLSIINDVLDMARIESGKVQIVEKVVNVNQMHDALKQMIDLNAQNKDLCVHDSIENVIHPYIHVDGPHVNQVISNLLSNAIKYTPDGGEIYHIVEEIPCERRGYAKFQTIVKDTGIGMSEEFQKKIFDEFERENNSTVSGVQGTGLGMTIVKRLVDLMNGSIEIDSEIGKGTTVYVTFEHRIATDSEIKEFQSQQKEKSTTDELPLRGMKILVVEDNDMNREIAEDLLTDCGATVYFAEDGDIAVEKVKNAKPDDYDVILMDIQMPRMDGYQATREIRKLPNKELADIPIVAMTANAFEEDRKNAIDAGMNDHLSKPIDLNKMNMVIAKYRRI